MSNGEQYAAAKARETRVDVYSQWIADDVDGITYAVNHHPAGQPIATAVLAEARERVALALSRLDRAIEADRAHHHEQEPA